MMFSDWFSCLSGLACPSLFSMPWLYVDDALVIMQGPKRLRDEALGLLLYTAAAFGVQIAFHKGERGLRTVWIGIHFGLDLAEKMLLLAIPRKMVDEIKKAVNEWKGKGMIPLKELRSVTGKVSWLAGVLGRWRWTANIMYAVIADQLKDLRENKEEERAKKRKDTRVKAHLVAVSRVELARVWLARDLVLGEAGTMGAARCYLGHHYGCLPLWDWCYPGGLRWEQVCDHQGVARRGHRAGGQAVECPLRSQRLTGATGSICHASCDDNVGITIEATNFLHKVGLGGCISCSEETLLVLPCLKLCGSGDGPAAGPHSEQSDPNGAPSWQVERRSRLAFTRARSQRRSAASDFGRGDH